MPRKRKGSGRQSRRKRARGPATEDARDREDNEIEKKSELMENFYKELLPWGEGEWETWSEVVRKELPTTFRATPHHLQRTSLLKELAEAHENPGSLINPKLARAGAVRGFLFHAKRHLENAARTNEEAGNGSEASSSGAAEFGELEQKAMSLADDEVRVIMERLPVAVFHQLLEQFPEMAMTEGELQAKGEKDAVLHTVEYLPREMQVWELGIGTSTLKAGLYKPLHQLIVRHNTSGALVRQEVVSMVPPLFLDPLSTDKVLDMCAAPGSKSTQLVTLMTRGGQQVCPSGVVVANDSDSRRSQTMTHRLMTMNLPNWLSTVHEAQHFPIVGLNAETRSFFQFDRILADVPCSGDGTLRKSITAWRWNAKSAMALHSLQVSIVMRGAVLLRLGGRRVYSTCSMHPVENEAVVAQVLRACQGSLQLADVSSMYPALRRRPGLHSWFVQAPSGASWSSLEQAEAAPEPGCHPKSSWFAPSSQEAESMQLSRCMRFMPHDQNTGAFFVAVFEKTSVLPDSLFPPFLRRAFSRESPSLDGTASKNEAAPTDSEKPQPVEDDKNISSSTTTNSTTTTDLGVADSASDVPQASSPPSAASSASSHHDVYAIDSRQIFERGWKMQSRGREEPFIPLTSPSIMDMLRKNFGLTEDLPWHRFVVRSSRVNTIYIVSESVVDLLRADSGSRIAICNMGLRVFARRRVGSTEHFRGVAEGWDAIAPFVRESHKVYLKGEDLKLLWCNVKVPLSKLQSTATTRTLSQGGSAVYTAEIDFSDVLPEGTRKISLPLFYSSLTNNLQLNKGKQFTFSPYE